MSSIKKTDEAEIVKRLFTLYLEQKGYRKTSERFTILEEIYSRDGHFDVDSLHEAMKAKRYAVSLATLYNTLELLLDCNLIKKHQFGKGSSYYEKSYECDNHDHLICTNCGAVIEFWDPRIKQIQTTAAEMKNFQVSYHVLYFYGLCENCRKKIEEENQNKQV